MLPLFFCAVTLGVGDELAGLAELASAVHYWKTFCSSLDVLAVRR